MEESRNKRLYRVDNLSLIEIESIPSSDLIFSSERADMDIYWSPEGEEVLTISGIERKGSFYISSSIQDAWIISHIVKGYESALWRDIQIDREYIERNIISMYADFDGAHQMDHAYAVIDNSVKMAEELGVNPILAYLVAAYHDIGLSISRERHHIESAIMFRKDAHIAVILNNAEIDILADAIEDHRASSASLPRSIYGIIISDSDRLLDPATVMKRTIKFGLKNSPGDMEHQRERCMEHLMNKYSRGGYLKYFLPSQRDVDNREKLYRIAESEELF